MQENCEFRVVEEFAHLLFSASDGKRLGDSIRKVTASTRSDTFRRIGEINRQLRLSTNRFFFHGWSIQRRYTRAELATAAIFHLELNVFEPTGEECGTRFDYSGCCPECGMPRRQVGDLYLDLRKVPKRSEIVATIADDEWIVSERLATLLKGAALTGFELRPVRHKARYQDDPYELEKLPAGRELVRLATSAGIQHGSPEYWSWLNRPDQAALLARTQAEHATIQEERARRRGEPLPEWQQVVITSAPVPIAPPTRAGNNPFDDDPEGLYRCRFGHVAGLNLLSEISVSATTWDGSDLCRTRELFGWPRRPGQKFYPVRVPAPMLLMSPQFRQFLIDHQVSGWKSDIAYLRE